MTKMTIQDVTKFYEGVISPKDLHFLKENDPAKLNEIIEHQYLGEEFGNQTYKYGNTGFNEKSFNKGNYLKSPKKSKHECLDEINNSLIYLDTILAVTSNQKTTSENRYNKLAFTTGALFDDEDFENLKNSVPNINYELIIENIEYIKHLLFIRIIKANNDELEHKIIERHQSIINHIGSLISKIKMKHGYDKEQVLPYILNKIILTESQKQLTPNDKTYHL